MVFEWEQIESTYATEAGFLTERAQVIGGWLVKNLTWDNQYHVQSESMCFVRDANHDWDIE
jgi:hypothetical protein